MTFYHPGSYADLYYNSPFGYSPRRPSPPPSAYYPCNPYDRYTQELAREQATRAALLKAAQQERTRRAMAARAEQQRRQQAIEQARRQRAAQLKQQYYRPQTWFGFPMYADEDEDEDEDNGDAYAAPTPEPQREASNSPQPSPSQPVMSSAPAEDMEKMEDAARTIQAAFRRHAALKHVSAVRDHFLSLDSSFSLPTHLAFQPDSFSDELERGKLIYTKENASVHAFVDSCERMLQELDAVESRGVAEVRDARKELVKEIEGRLRSLEEDIKKAWSSQQASVATELKEDDAAVPEIDNAPVDMDVTQEPTGEETEDVEEELHSAANVISESSVAVEDSVTADDTMDAEKGCEIEDVLTVDESGPLEEKSLEEDDSKEFVLV